MSSFRKHQIVMFNWYAGSLPDGDDLTTQRIPKPSHQITIMTATLQVN